MEAPNSRNDSPHPGWWLLLLALPTGLVVWSVACWPWLVERTCHEDGPVENLTAACYLVAAVGFLCRLPALDRVARAYVVGLALLCLFVGGEEISWGQRMFGWSTPTVVAEHNVQGETNLHNVVGVVSFVRALGLGIVALVFFVVPAAIARSARLRGYGLPTPSATSAVSACVAMLLMVVPRVLFGASLFELDEWAEFVLALGFLGFAVGDLEGRAAEPTTATLIHS